MEETDAYEAGGQGDGIGIQQIAVIAGLTDVPAFAAVTYFLFGDPLYGALAGAFTGLGIYLFLPWATSGDGDAGSSTGSPDTGIDAAIDGFHRGAAGMALGSAGIVFLAWLFVDESAPLIGLAGAIVLAAAEYAVLSQVFPRNLSES